ncbi:IclR family transcriptional regulator [Aureimonas altamirensis]|uniref:IclR family transcriptional regulator n=1 Tax=Aureimonas altamirensis TaxID=370622 RepID=UPI002036AF60|nr:IclR family transcriptional regulator [Aureimonas altamirensis]MCM2503807.1 IclR family transcriptional regulator [Aureimonas altamirensis]
MPSIPRKETEPPTHAPDDAASAGAGVAAVNRAILVLAAVENAEGPISLSEISRVTGLYKSTVLRLADTLQHSAYVSRLENGHYVLGAAIMRMGIAYERSSPIRRQLQPVLQSLVDQGTESASFHVRHGDSTRLCLMRIDSRHSTLDRVHAGDILPLAHGAAGTVILANAHDAPDDGRFAAVRENGLAISIGERDPACAGMAAPVFSAGGRLLGALSLSGPRERFSPADIERMRKPLLQACEELSVMFGAGRNP